MDEESVSDEPKTIGEKTAGMERFPGYFTFYWDMKKAFESSKSLVDEAAGAPVFDDVIDSLKSDPNGPKIDLRKDLINQLGQRVSFFGNYRLPIVVNSERWLVAIEVTNPATVAETLNKAMKADPDANERVIGKRKVWEIERQEEPEGVGDLEIDGAGFGEFDEEEERGGYAAQAAAAFLCADVGGPEHEA